MTDREKLIEILEVLFCSATALDIASYLIDNGVTVQKWIPVAERLPELGVRVLIFDSYQGISIGKALWTASPIIRRIELVEQNDPFYYTEITHWMPLPEPPKGE